MVQLCGTLESGRSFLVRDTRQVPHFWIRASDRVPAQVRGATIGRDETPRVNFGGAPVVRVDVGRPQDVPPLRDRLIAAGIPCYEADVRFAYRYLIDRGIRGAVEIVGDARPGEGVDEVYDDPDVVPAEWIPTLSVLSIDIETDPTASRLLSIALVGPGVRDVLLLTPEGLACPDAATACADEAALLRAFVARVREIDPDVLTGWNVVDFDLRVLDRVAARLGVPLPLGRGDEPLRLPPPPAARAAARAVLPGRLVMDGIDLVRGAFVKLEGYSLERASREILGKGKTIVGGNRASAILDAFHHDREHFVAYNRRDAELVLEILEELKLIELSVQRSLLTGLPPDRVSGSIAAFDFLYLSALARRGIVAPTVRAGRDVEAQAGGHVLEPAPGLYRNVLMLDFKSLYPSVIRTFQIDPLGYRPDASAEPDLIRAPNGAAFSRADGILPYLLDDLFPKREAAKAAGDRVASHAIKILMNSFYGVLGTPACRFASSALTGAITSFGRTVLLWAKEHVENRGYRVLYGDTDSLFVLSGADDADAAQTLGETLARDLNAELARHVEREWRVESRLELEFEKLYLRLILPAVRHGTTGARKRYAGLLRAGDGAPVVELTGLEAVRRDWTELARRVQRELYDRLFHDRPVDAYVRDIVAGTRAGRYDAQLVYRKGLRRGLDTYIASNPPHVAAARKMTTRPGRVIAYVVTTEGPEPATERRAPIDHEHYVQKQIRAVAEPVLTLLDLDFDRVVGDEVQLRLF